MREIGGDNEEKQGRLRKSDNIYINNRKGIVNQFTSSLLGKVDGSELEPVDSTVD